MNWCEARCVSSGAQIGRGAQSANEDESDERGGLHAARCGWLRIPHLASMACKSEGENDVANEVVC